MWRAASYVQYIQVVNTEVYLWYARGPMAQQTKEQTKLNKQGYD